MCRAFINKIFHSFPSLGNVFIIQFLKFIMLLLNWIILAGGQYFPIKSSLHLSQESMLFLGKDCSHSLSLPLKEKGKKLQLDNVTIYFLLLFHITKLNKII